MKTHNEHAGEYCDLDNVELAFVVNLGTLRIVLKTLSVGGQRWWLATDPSVAVDHGYVTLAFGYPGCEDPLNTIYFRLPVLSEWLPPTGTDRIVVLFDACHFFVDQPRCERGGDCLEDFTAAFSPVKEALLRRMETGQ